MTAQKNIGRMNEYDDKNFYNPVYNKILINIQCVEVGYE